MSLSRLQVRVLGGLRAPGDRRSQISSDHSSQGRDRKEFPQKDYDFGLDDHERPQPLQL